MKILVAEDDLGTRRVLESVLKKWGYEVISTGDGLSALHALQSDDSLTMAVLDWKLPGMSGTEVCEQVRKGPKGRMMYLLLLSARVHKNDIIEGLNSGADDYLTKPFHPEELHARINNGVRIVNLQSALANRLVQLQTAMTQVKFLQGLMPMCGSCKRVHDNKNYWQAIEEYVSNNSDLLFSHSICPDCYETYVKPDLMNFKIHSHVPPPQL